MKNKINHILILVSLLLVAACTNNSEGTATDSAAKASSGVSAEKQTPENLEAILPDALLNMPKKISSKGNPKMKSGVEISMARLVYREEGREVQFEIYDSGKTGETMDSYRSWTGQTFNTDNDELVEKSSTFEGFPSYEKFLKADKKSELHVLPNKRFELVLKGTNVSVEELKQALKQWNIVSSLAGLK